MVQKRQQQQQQGGVVGGSGSISIVMHSLPWNLGGSM
jgi:hypothetical protein